MTELSNEIALGVHMECTLKLLLSNVQWAHSIYIFSSYFASNRFMFLAWCPDDDDAASYPMNTKAKV